MGKLLFGVFATVFLVLGLMAVGLSTSLIGGGAPSASAQEDIPPPLLPVYQTAADSCPGLPWSVFAPAFTCRNGVIRGGMWGVGSLSSNWHP